MAKWQTLKSKTNIEIPVATFSPESRAKAVVLFLPALGVKAKFYKHVAQGLASEGYETVLFEQRGHGESPYWPDRGSQVGYTEYLEEDLPTVLRHLEESYPDIPLFVGGHSLGAHLANYLAAKTPDRFMGLFHIACIFPYYRFFSRKEAFQVRLLCCLIPLLTKLLGYYPGKKLGFGAKEYRQVMLDWRTWALTGNYDYGDTPNIEEAMSKYAGNLISISIEGDGLASDQALKKPNEVMKSAKLTRVHLTSAEQGANLGHFNWARKPDGVVTTLSNWIDKCLT